MINSDGIPLEKLTNDNNQHLVNAEGLDLMKRMLVYDKNNRITPEEAMKHPYFYPLFDKEID